MRNIKSLARKILLNRCEYYINKIKEINEYIFNANTNIFRMEDELKSLMILSEKEFRDKIYDINPDLIRDSGGGYDELDMYINYGNVNSTVKTLRMMGFDRQLSSLRRASVLENDIKHTKISVEYKKEELNKLSKITNEVLFNSWLIACREVVPIYDFFNYRYVPKKSFITVRTEHFTDGLELLGNSEYDKQIKTYFVFALDEAFRTIFSEE